MRVKPITRAFAAVLLFFCLSTPTLSGQTKDAPQATLTTPYSTIRTHLYYLQDDTYDPALSALSIPPEIDRAGAERLAIQIKQIYDGKGLYVRMNMIPQNPEYTDSAAMAHVYTPFPKELPEVYLERTDSLWYYSLETIEAVPALHRHLYPFGADLLSRRIPDWMRQRFLGITLWQYLGLIVLILLTWLLHVILSRVFRPVVAWLAAHIKNLGYADPKDIRQAARLTSFLLVVFLADRAFPTLQLPIRWSSAVNAGIAIFTGVLCMLLALVIVSIVTRRFSAIAASTESKMDDQLLPIVRKSLQITVIVVTGIYILTKLDVNVTAMIAGLSIGALALALAAQDTVKNLIGSITIFSDRPFQVGDFVTIDGQEGTIIEVGFRSTRIQLIDTSIVSIPNGNVANITIMNLGVRQFRLMNILIGITYDTPPEKIEAYISELKNLILAHPRVHKENYLVHFREMGDFSLKILFRCYIPVFTFPEELEIKEELYLEIMRIAQRLGIKFAFPSQTIYVAGNGEGNEA